MKIALGIPVKDCVYGEVYGSHLALVAEMARAGELTILSPYTAPSVDLARGFIWNFAKESDYLMFVDQDILLPLKAFDTLLEVMQRRGAQVVAGRYPLRGYPYANIWASRNEGRLRFTESSVEAEIQGCGMGCTLIDVKWVLEHLEEPLFVTSYDSLGRVRETEDYYFCKHVTEAGGTIVGVPSVECGHVEARRTVVTVPSADLLRRKELLGVTDQG